MDIVKKFTVGNSPIIPDWLLADSNVSIIFNEGLPQLITVTTSDRVQSAKVGDTLINRGGQILVINRIDANKYMKIPINVNATTEVSTEPALEVIEPFMIGMNCEEGKLYRYDGKVWQALTNMNVCIYSPSLSNESWLLKEGQ